MTSWQDQPPQTRRQAREHQRAAEGAIGSAEAGPMPVSRRAATVAATPAGEVPDVTTPFSFASKQRDSDAREPATDAPPVRPRAPHYDGLSFDNLLAASHAGEPANAPVPDDERPPARVTYLPGVQAPQASNDTESHSAETASAASAHSSDGPTAPDGHLLTRRELRAMLQAQAANDAVQKDESPSVSQPSGPVAPASQASVESPVDVSPVPEPTIAPVVPTPAIPVLNEETAPVAARSAESGVQTSASSFADALGVAPTAGTDPAVTEEHQAETKRVVPPATPASAVAAPVTVQAATVSEPSALAVPSMEPSAPTTDPQLLARSAGHWSTMDDDSLVDTGSTPRSSVATGSVTTANALILPSIPSEGMATSPLTSTGEVIVTGSINLPRSLGSTGQHPDHFDSSDIDRLFEESDAGPGTSSVAPVRASKAVATHTSTRGMITPPKSRGNKLPVILAVTAAVLLVGVGALLVAGFVFHAF